MEVNYLIARDNKFVHLRNYSQYSLSKGALRIKELVNFCKDEKMPATTISDFNNLFGSLEFCIECEKNGIQPIIGSNILIKDEKYKNGYILLLCKNKVGYKNLIKLVSKSYLEKTTTDNPYLSLTDLKHQKSGLMCLCGGEFGVLTNNYKENKLLSDNLIGELNEIFNDNFFLEIQRYKNQKSYDYENYLINKSYLKKIPLVATNENFYLKKEFFKSHDALLSISQQKYLDSDDRIKSKQEYYLKSSDEMIDLFSDIPQVCKNTVLIAKRCSFYLQEKPPSLPKIHSNESDENTLLRRNSENGLKERLKLYDENQLDEVYHKRLNYELDVIMKMGYSSYFLIVSDFINWPKSNSIPVGPGRGSGAGSLVAWCLSITDLDPLKFGLIFERFLNPERISLPDFDIDFCMDKRDEVIKYVQKKYGDLNVAQIITFGSFQARAALRDVGRVLQLPLNQVDEFCKMIPFNPANPVTLKDFFKENKAIRKMVKNDSNIKNLFEISINLEGLLRHASTHAAGIVIAEKSLDESIPLYKDPKSDIPVTQFSMKYVEKFGLIKFDFLGLKTLTVIDETIKNLKNRGVNIKIDKIPLDDDLTYKMLRSGMTTGVFQMEGQGMKETIIKIKPDRFEDLIAIVSLYRPGPMDNIPIYINRKQNKESYDYIHDDLKEILDETYGIMVYQEQVMLIAQKLAGFSLAKADLLRRAMGKKIKSEMVAQREEFILGCVKNNISEDKSSNLFDEIAKFAGYGFNKSHAAAYAMIAYQTAFLKSNYPLEFFCALMNCDINNFDKLSIYCSELKKIGFKVINPDINYSETNFVVNYDENHDPVSIKFGLGAIKNVGEQSISELVRNRQINGKFKNLNDLLIRLSNNVLNKKILEALIFSNSMSSIEKNQKYLFNNIDKIILFNSNFHKNFNQNQASLFPQNNDLNNYLEQKNQSDWKLNEKLNREVEAFGFYLSEHPTRIYKNIYEKENILDLEYLNSSTTTTEKNKIFSFIAMLNNINERKSKTGKKFCFLNLGDDSGSIDSICFSEVLENLNFNLKSGEIYRFRISKQNMNDSERIVINDIKKLEKYENNKNSYKIKLYPDKLDFIKFKKLLDKNIKGENKIDFAFVLDNKEIEIHSNHKYNVDLEFIIKIKALQGILNFEEIN